MKITILGTGCIWTKRACASYLINDDILVDPGSGTLKQLFKSSNKLLHHEKIEKIKLFLITHYHMDHYFDIVYFMWKIASEKNPNLYATIICPPGGREKIETLCKLGMGESSSAKLNFDKYIKFIDASQLGTFEYGNFEITSQKMDHNDIECYGYTIKEKGGKTVSFTGDTTMCDGLMNVINNSDIAFVDMAGTDISCHHYNIVDGIELMKQYYGKCCIIPCHLTSQAIDYCQGRIDVPKDLMTIDTDDKMPYDYVLREKKTKTMQGANKNFKFMLKNYERIEGTLIDLVLSITKSTGINYKMPTYCFDIMLRDTSSVIGNAVYSVVPEGIDGHNNNLTINLEKDYQMKSILYEVCIMIQKIAKMHNSKCLYLTCAPDDFGIRRVYESLGAYLKEIKTFFDIDENGNRIKSEKCIWVWEFENGK